MGQELCRHPFPVDHDPLHTPLLDCLLMVSQQVRHPTGQMLIPSRGRRKPRMASLIVQQNQFATAQDFSVEPAHWPAWNEHGTVNRLAMAVHVEHRWRLVSVRRGLLLVPQRPCPPGEHFSQAFSGLGASQSSEKAFGIALTVGSLTARKERQHGSRVMASIPGAGYPSHRQKEHRAYQTVDHGGRRTAACQCQVSYPHDCRDQRLQQPGLVSRCQQQQTADPFLPDRLGSTQFFPGAPPLASARAWSLQRLPVPG